MTGEDMPKPYILKADTELECYLRKAYGQYYITLENEVRRKYMKWVDIPVGVPPKEPEEVVMEVSLQSMHKKVVFAKNQKEMALRLLEDKDN